MNPYLVPALEASCSVFERLLTLIAESRLDEPLVAGRFTPREVMAHMADWEPIMRERVLLAVRAPGSTIEVYDESAMATTHGYSATDPVEQFRLFHRERRATVAAIGAIDANDWSKVVSHPERGPLSAADLANLLLGHDMYHIEQLTAYLVQGDGAAR